MQAKSYAKKTLTQTVPMCYFLFTAQYVSIQEEVESMPEIDLNQMAERLKKARGDKTREEVCKEVGISRSALMMYENGKRIPRDRIKIRLANFYNVGIEELFYYAS